MSVTKELIEQEKQLVQAGQIRDVHLHREGTFLRAYDWSAFLCCHYLHEFKVSKRAFKGIDEPVAYQWECKHINWFFITLREAGFRRGRRRAGCGWG